ncbi:hypothetical protein [Novosphingobium lindaniclasticum]|nr:hypothetical protein [Novosphingobium lindaniclasticum]
MTSRFRTPTEKVVRDVLEKHACPVRYHEVRTRFLGAIASPLMGTSPLPVVKGLWGGEFPPFDSMDDLNHLIDVLINQLWNSLTWHNSRTASFRLYRLELDPSAENLARYARVRRQELEGFVEGLFGGHEALELPERAHMSLGHLGELRAMMGGIEDLVARDIQAESRTQLETTFRHVRELTKIMETEIHEAVLSCARAQHQMLEGFTITKPVMH